jgi:hypothetical protein
METRPIAIHAVQMLNHGHGFGEVTCAKWAPGIEDRANQLHVFFATDFNWPLLTDLAT